MSQSQRMKRITLGPTGFKVTKLGFGALPIQPLTHEDAVQVVRYAYEKGIDFYDTARMYTNSEERVGEALEPVRHKVILATKGQAFERDKAEELFETSMQNLRTDYFDLYQVHNIMTEEAFQKVIDNRVLAYLEKEQKKGRIRHLGISTHRLDMAMKFLEMPVFKTIMVAFNFVEDEPQQEFLPKADALGKGVIVMKPVGGGVLENVTASLKWISNQGDYLIIPGMKSAEEIDANWEAIANDKLTESEGSALQQEKDYFGENPFCHRCHYCLPCPREINVAFIAFARNFFERGGWGRLSDKHLETFKKGLTCIECGQCEDRCPYSLPLTRLVKEESRWLLDEAQKRGFDIHA